MNPLKIPVCVKYKVCVHRHSFWQNCCKCIYHWNSRHLAIVVFPTKCSPRFSSLFWGIDWFSLSAGSVCVCVRLVLSVVMAAISVCRGILKEIRIAKGSDYKQTLIYKYVLEQFRRNQVTEPLWTEPPTAVQCDSARHCTNLKRFDRLTVNKHYTVLLRIIDHTDWLTCLGWYYIYITFIYIKLYVFIL